MLGYPEETAFGLAGGKLGDERLVVGELVGGKSLDVGAAPNGSGPCVGTLVAFVEASRLAEGALTPPFAGDASDVKSGSEDEGNPLFGAVTDGATGSEGNVAAEDGKDGGDTVSRYGNAAGGRVAELAPLSGTGAVPLLGTGKGDPRVAAGRARELSLSSNSRSFGLFVGMYAPGVEFAVPPGADCVGDSTDGAASPTRLEVSGFEFVEGSTGGATRVSAVLIGFMLGFTPGLTPVFAKGLGLEVLVGESRSLLLPCAMGVASVSFERRLIIREASNRGGSAAFVGPSNANGTAGPLYVARTVELASDSYDLLRPGC